LLGDLGGVLEVFLIVFTLFVAPISEFSYYLKLSKLLYFARVKNPDLLSKTDDKDNLNFNAEIEQEEETIINKEIKIHRTIKLSSCDKFRLFVTLKLGACSPFKSWSKNKQLKSLYEEAKEKVDS
jgi:hypothetical protein